MSMQIQAVVGPQSLATGAPAPAIRAGSSGELIISEAHGRYYEPTVRKQVFSGGNAATVTTTVGTATTYTGLALTNPIGSTVNLVVNKVGWTSIIAPAAAQLIGLMTGFSSSTQVTQTTPITPYSNFVGNVGGAGLLASSATLQGTPTVRTILGGVGTVAVGSESVVSDVTDLEGSIVIPPGGYVAFFTSTVGTGMAFSFQWEEVSITI